ncbi:MAG: arginine deiminase family protein [Desulfobacteraceae bacterium]|jgi:dimethylargininase
MACYHFNSAIVREPSRSVVHGLSANGSGAPDYEGVNAEHNSYIAALESAGVAVTVLPALESYPDSIFVEDPALVFTEGAILLRPGAPSRLGEPEEIASTLNGFFGSVQRLPRPGHVDGGDVLVTPESVMIGLSARTDQAGAEALIQCLKALGYKGRIVYTPKGVLHFKTECALLDQETVLVTHRMARTGIFDGFRKIMVPDGEEPAANAVRINGSVLASSQYQRTIDIVSGAGYAVLPVKTTEIEKIDAGLSCMSLRWFR